VDNSQFCARREKRKRDGRRQEVKKKMKKRALLLITYLYILYKMHARTSMN